MIRNHRSSPKRVPLVGALPSLALLFLLPLQLRADDYGTMMADVEAELARNPIRVSEMAQPEGTGITLAFRMEVREDGDSTVMGGMNLGAQPTASGGAGGSAGGATEETGFLMESWNTIRSPFFIYRFDDGKWFPEWREHPVRTTITTIVYAGLIVLATQGDSEESTSTGTTSTTTSTTTDTGGGDTGDTGGSGGNL